MTPVKTVTIEVTPIDFVLLDPHDDSGTGMTDEAHREIVRALGELGWSVENVYANGDINERDRL